MKLQFHADNVTVNLVDNNHQQVYSYKAAEVAITVDIEKIQEMVQAIIMKHLDNLEKL